MRPKVLLAYAAMAFFIMGALGFYSYIVPLLTTVSGVSQDYVPLVLFGMGFCGVFGNLIGGWLADRNGLATMIGVLATFVVIMLALAALTHNALSSIICLLMCWGVAYGFPVPIQARLLKEAADAPNFASTLSSTANHLGIAIAAALGGAAISAGWGYGSLPLLAAAAELMALVAVVALALYGRSRTAVAPNPA
jgi:DHA1 family inner membrane transport protein